MTVSERGETVKLVVVLQGDVNGSWQSPLAAPQSVPDKYFRYLPLELDTPVGASPRVPPPARNLNSQVAAHVRRLALQRITAARPKVFRLKRFNWQIIDRR